MNVFYEWAAAWGIPPGALNDLRKRLMAGDEVPLTPGVSEAAVQNQVRLEATRKGGRLWRNNVGALPDARGVPVRYGLANDSAAVNAVIKSSDLIGLMPKIVTAAHIGQTWGVYTARECKDGSWRYAGTEREQAQLRYLTLVSSLGGDAAFCTGEGTL
jgi:hypothetical protein